MSKLYTYDELPESVKKKIISKFSMNNLISNFAIMRLCTHIFDLIQYLKENNIYDEEVKTEMFILSMGIDQ